MDLRRRSRTLRENVEKVSQTVEVFSAPVRYCGLERNDLDGGDHLRDHHRVLPVSTPAEKRQTVTVALIELAGLPLTR
jgi:hypothetical protein